MVALGLVGFVVMTGCVLGVGLRLLQTARRTRRAPETAIGTACVGTSLGGLGIIAGGRIADPGLALPVSAAGQLLMNLGTLAMALGLWRNFRPGSRLAGLGCAALAGVLLVSWVLVLRPGVPILPTDSSAANLVLRGVRIGAYVWAAWECLSYHAKLRRRLPLGLADPVNAAQMLLWGASAAAMAVVLSLALGCGVLLGVSVAEWAPGLIASAGLGLFSGVALWCAFFPPASYRRFVESHTPVEA